jgi:nicotinate-nucleotide pyrophosphorylase (carboxylating)
LIRQAVDGERYMLVPHRVRRIIQTALDEDIGSGDLTSASTLTGNEKGAALAMAKSELIVAGMDVFRDVFIFLDGDIKFDPKVRDGHRAKTGETLAVVSGNLRNILTAERVALNLFQRMSGIATLTRQFVNETAGTRAKILDTRKTAPGLRILDKYAVTVGGGFNHRIGLFDGVMIKDNHIEAAGSIKKAVDRVCGKVPPTIKIEVEVKNLGEVEEAIAAGAHIIMLDNMKTDEMKKAVSLIGGRALIEASGNVSLKNVREIARTGVDFISVGALTHSVEAADISLKVRSEK